MDSHRRASHSSSSSSSSPSSASGKPKLDRKNALKLSDHELPSPLPVPSPRSASPSPYSAASSSAASSPAFPPLRKTAPKKEAISTSFTLTGQDSESQLVKICEELGLLGGIDAFSIPQDAWEAGKSRTNSIDRNAFSGSGSSISSSTTSDSIFASSNDSSFSESSVSITPSGSVEFVESLLPVQSDGAFGPISHAEDDGNPTTERIFNEMEYSLQQQTSHQPPPFIAETCLDVPLADDLSEEFRKTDLNHQPILSEHLTPQEEIILPPARVKPNFDVPSNQDLIEEPIAIHINEQPITTSEDRVQDDDSLNGSSNSSVLKREEEFMFVSQAVQRNGAHADDNVPALMINPAPQNTPPRVNIGPWRKLEQLGSGSFGTVYEGLSEDGIYFAVKEVSLSENDSKAQQCVSQLEQEIDVLSKFQHENIVRYFGTQKELDKLYIFLELVTKGSLASLYQKYPLFDSQIRIYTRQILNGLKYLHDCNIMHRDIKCANILVDTNGRIKVADFGLAKQISKLDELKSCKGSAYWMAPEVIDPRKTYSFPADIWSLGCSVLEMIIRGPPFGDLEWHRVLWKVGHGEPPSIPDSLSEDAKSFIRKCLEVDPTKRPSAAQLLEHPFVQHTGGSGFTPRNSFCQESVELRMVIEADASQSR